MSILDPQKQTVAAEGSFATNPYSNPSFALTGWGSAILPASPYQFRNTLKTLGIINNASVTSPISVSSGTWSSGLATIQLPTQAGSLYTYGVNDTFTLSGASISAYNNGWQASSVSGTSSAGPLAITFYTSGSNISGSPTGNIYIQQTAQLNLCAFGDSVAPKKPNQLFPQIYASIPVNSVNSVTHTTGGHVSTNPGDFQVTAEGGSFSISGGDGWVTYGNGGNNPFCDTITVIYAQESGAGAFKLQSSTDVGGPITWNDITGYTNINASSSSLSAGVIALKNSYGSYGVRAMHVSGGAVRIANIVSRALSKNGYNRYDFSQGGIAQAQMLTQSGDFRQAQVAAINPTLLSSEWKDSYTTVPVTLPPLVAAFQLIKPTDWIFNATTPVSADAAYDATPTTSPTYLENTATQSVAYSGGWYYFGEGWSLWQKYSELTRMGLEGDGTHVAILADQIMGNILAKNLWFLVSQFGNVGFNNQYVDNALTIGNTPDAPVIGISGISSTADAIIQRHGGNFTYFKDGSGNNIAILSSHAAQYGNPSVLPTSILFSTFGVTGAFLQFDGPSHTALLRTTFGNGTTSYYSDVDAPFRSLNTPAYFQQGNVYNLVAGAGPIAANTSGNYTLPASPKQNGIYGISAMNTSWTLHQNASQIIRGGSKITTIGTGGYVSSTGVADSITLLYAGLAGGLQEFRVIASSDINNLVWT